MSFLHWLKWWFWETRRCDHEMDDKNPVYPNMGMNKAWHCKKCGKCLKFI